MEKEIWKDVAGFEGDYMVSNFGKVMSVKRGTKRILNLFLSKKGYQKVTLSKKGEMKQVFVHRILAESFIGRIKEGFSVNHKDGNKLNNNLYNLEVITHKENIHHSIYVLGNSIKPILMLDSKTFEVLKEFPSIAQASLETGIDNSSIYRVCADERNHAGGYSWAFKDKYSEETKSLKENRLKKKYSARKPIKQIDKLTGQEIAIYQSVKEAKEVTGIKTIVHCVTDRTKTAGGFYWEYVTNE